MQRLRKGDLERRIRDLGSLPDEAFEKYRGLSLKRLQQELAQVRRGSWQPGSVQGPQQGPAAQPLVASLASRAMK